jgi:long-subunit fatty acid transport protein
MRHHLGSALATAAAAASCLLLPRAASAAGFDTPILYSARHQAMGGTAISYVDDPSAAFHNPAGLQGVKGLAFLGDFSLILGKIKSSPQAPLLPGGDAETRESETVVAPFFLVGAAYRISDLFSVGLAGFPVASGGAEYKFKNIAKIDSIDSTEIVFLEVTPLLSLNVPKNAILPGKLSLGAGYRVSMVSLDRRQGREESPQALDLQLSGASFAGYRVGLQYQPIDALKLGVVYRNKIRVTTKADEGKALNRDWEDIELEFTLPAKLGFGARVDLGPVGVAADVEWAFQSQNTQQELSGVPVGDSQRAAVTNIFNWQNGVTGRFGFEYRLGQADRTGMFSPRVGYIIDSKVSNEAFPSAFGTPPTATHTLTAGIGYKREIWQVNLAASRRVGSTTIAKEDLGSGCGLCSYAGDYKMTMTGMYIDASVDLPL